MKPTKLFLALAVAVLLGACATRETQNNRVWNEVAMGYNNNNNVIKVTGVKLLDEHTEVALHITFPAGYWIKMASNIYLQAEDKQYKVKAIVPDSKKAVPEFDKEFWMPESGEVDFVMQFEPLPEGTEQFDFIEPDGWQMLNVRNARLLPQGITDTYWRNAKTGDWLIGFAEQHVIYDNAVWDIVTQTERDGSYALTISRGAETMDVAVGPMKEGSRRIAVGKGERIKCLPITTSTLPDYPKRDRRQGFKDNGYRMGDSVTIVGWLKDMPRQAWSDGSNAFDVAFQNIIHGEEQKFYAPLDSLGRFALKIPIINVSQTYLDWRRSQVRTVFEPGETYFFLSDYSTGHTLFMGSDARLQNELMTYPPIWDFQALNASNASHEEAMKFFEHTDSVCNALYSELDKLTSEHPTLSQRYIDYARGLYLIGRAEDLLYARFSIADDQFPQEYFEYAEENIWEKVHPYTLYGDYSRFMESYLALKDKDGPNDVNTTAAIKSLAERGAISLTEEEINAVDNYEKEYAKVRFAINAAKTSDEKKALEKSFYTGALVTTLNNLIPRIEDELTVEILCQNAIQQLDSVNHTSLSRDICIARCLNKYLLHSNKPLPPATIAWMEQEIQLPAAKAAVMELNEKYLALQRRELVGNSLKSSDDVEGMSDGEKILRKLIEPYKGKLILLDIWGTWCAPCKAALKNSQEEYEHLKDYDIVYLYLANRSDEESWKNVIKEYNVTGDNVVHYNLPAEQQTAIEHFLGVNSFPTYKLIDRDGNILDVNADPRDLNALENLLKTMNGTKN